MRVLLEYLENNYTIPEEFRHMCEYRVKWFIHDFGRYSEIVLIYDDHIFDQWDEDNPDKFNRFWDWFNDIEAVNLESDYLHNEISSRYQAYLTKIKTLQS